MTGKPHTRGPASPAGRRAHTMPGQRAVNLLVRAMLRTPGPAPIAGLRTGEPVAIRLQGNRRPADVHVSTTEPDVVSAYAHMARANPTFAKFSNIHLSEDGEPDHHDLSTTSFSPG